MTPRTRLTALALALAVTALAGCGSTPGSTPSAAGSSDTLRLAFLGTISTPDPDTAYDGSELNLVNSAYEGLVAYQPGQDEAKLVGRLATAWTAGADNTVFTFTLRDGVTFHDGTPFTSAAVEASFTRRTTVDGGPAYMVKGVKTVATPDAQHVVITLKEPNSAFLDLLASPFGPKMISPTALKAHPWTSADDDWFATHDAGTGPYAYGTFDPGVSYALTAYPKYWGTQPGYSTVRFDVLSSLSTIQLKLQHDELDGLIGYADSAAFSTFQADKTLTSYTFASMQTPTLFVNPKSKALSTTATRTALLAGVDFPALATAALGGTATSTTEVFPKNLLPATVDQQKITHDASALTTLASGALDGKTVTCGYAGSSPSAQALCDNLTAMLNKAGITAKSVGYASGTYYSSLADPAKAPDVTFFSGFPDTAHPDAWATVFYTPDGGLDLFGAEVPGLAAILAQAAQTDDTALYGRAAAMVSSSGYWYSVASSLGTAVFQPEVGGVEESRTPVITGVLELQLLHPAAS